MPTEQELYDQYLYEQYLAEQNLEDQSSSVLDFASSLPMVGPLFQPQVKEALSPYMPDAGNVASIAAEAPSRLWEGVKAPFHFAFGGGWEDTSAADVANFTGRGSAMAAGGLAGQALVPIPVLGTALGATAGGFLYDQYNQVLGNTEDTPLKSDLERALGGDFVDNIVASGAGKLAGEGRILDSLYDRKKARYGAISPNPQDYLKDVRGLTPMNEAIDRTGDLLQGKLGNEPFADLYGKYSAEQNAVGANLDDMAAASTKRIPIAEVDPRAVLADEGAIGTTRKTVGKIADVEYEDIAQRSLKSQYGAESGAVMYDEYSKLRQMKNALEQEKLTYQAQDASGITNRFDSESIMRRREIDQTLPQIVERINDYESQISQGSLSTSEAQVLKRQYESHANYERSQAGGAISTRAEAFGDLGDNARERLVSAMNDPAFVEANQRYGDTTTIARALNERQGWEQTASQRGIVRRAWDTVTDPIRELFSDKPFRQGNPHDLLRISRGETLPQRFAAGQNYAAPALDILGTGVGASSMMANSPNLAPQITPDSLSINLTPPPVIPQQGLPRSLNDVPPEMVLNVLPHFVAPQDVEPLALQWRSVVASGDRSQMAAFLGEMSAKYPDFPLQRGAVTGLPSEFDIGDGKARLFSPVDIAQWESKIEKSPLGEDEKALRIMSLKTDGLVVPFTEKVNTYDAPIEPTESMNDPAYDYMLKTHPFSPRKKTIFGSQRIQ